MKKTYRLTREQRVFAEQNHSLVGAFLGRNHLDENEFYDVVVFGYLDAVREYLEKPELSKYRFSSIAWRKMKYCMINEFIYRSWPKRKAPVGTYQEDYDTVVPDHAAENLDDRVQVQQLMSHMTPKEKEVVCMRAAGFTYREIAEYCDITIRGVSARLEKMRRRFRAQALI